ncbi:MAG: mechanosensitive ion channel [Candidatus Eisenbacteria bacterium]
MDESFSLQSTIADVLRSLSSAVSALAPRILTALVVILIGYLAAKVTEKALRGALTKIRFDSLLEKIGIQAALKRVGLHGSPSQALARVVYYLLVVLFVQSATESVGLTAISGAIQAFFGYLPNVIAALIVILLGSVVAEYASKAVTRSAQESGIDYAESLGRIVSALVFFVVLVMAVTQLQIETDIIKSVAIVLLGGVSLGLALSFGLGTRDITRNIVAGFYARKIFDSGETIEMGGVKGTLVSIAPTQTIVEVGDEIVSVPNHLFLDTAVKQ